MARRLLDLFCGAGGAATGYSQAGFEVVGVDRKPQPKYPFDFTQDDAFSYLAKNWWKFDAIHASPPCQHYSALAATQPGTEYPDLVAKVRCWLNFYDKPYIIENVPGAPLPSPVTLCGTMFGLDLYRHRLFQCSFPVKKPKHPFHHRTAVQPADWEPGKIMSVVGNCSPIDHARTIMGIDWMTAEELSQAIPPAYTQYVGDALRRHLDREAVKTYTPRIKTAPPTPEFSASRGSGTTTG